MSLKTEEKRKEFAEWTGEYLERGFIPWQSPPVPSSVPESAVSGRPYKGLNALYLLRPIREEGFTDSRWITEKDANKQGYNVKAGEEGVSLEYWGTRDGKPGTHSYSVFNVGQLDSFPERYPDICPNYDRADIILKSAGADIPQKRDEAAYRDALEKTLADTAAKTPFFSEAHTQDLKALRLTIANTFLM
jgi:antirestriction protein ArdC